MKNFLEMKKIKIHNSATFSIFFVSFNITAVRSNFIWVYPNKSTINREISKPIEEKDFIGIIN